MRYSTFIFFIFLFTLINSRSLLAQQASPDTVKKNVLDTLKKDLFTVPDTVQHLHSKTRSLIPPAIMVAYGVSSFYITGLRRLDRSVYTETYKHNFVPSGHLEDYFQFTPVALTYGLNLVGVHGKNTFIDRTLTLGLAEGMLGVTLYVLKHSTHRLRPNGADYYSFPSGHTANAFSEAEFMSQELGGNSPLYGVVGYTFATATGVLRIYHQDHWLSDVIAGAGFGILATKGAYLVYPYIRNALFRGREQNTAARESDSAPMKRKIKRNALLLPRYQSGSFGMEFTMEF